MGQRMFIAVRPPAQACEEVSDFLEPRHGMPWIAPEQWHVTLAFLESVPEHRIDDLAERLRSAFERRHPFETAIRGAGCFPDALRARVLWLGVQTVVGAPDTEWDRLAVNARAAANAVGAPPDGRAFVPHLTLARLKRPIEATKWLRVLDTFAGGPWPVTEVELVASHLREGPAGRPRHEVVARLPIGSPGEEPPLVSR